jgi:hypothetical protein
MFGSVISECRVFGRSTFIILSMALGILGGSHDCQIGYAWPASACDDYEASCVVDVQVRTGRGR